MSEQSAGADRSVHTGPGEAGTLSRSYLDALRAADVAGAYKVAAGALAGGMAPAALYQRVIAAAMQELGRLWEAGAITIADEHLATALTHRVLTALRSSELLELTLGARSGRSCALLAAVEGERHALGLRMAADLLEDAGYQTVYLGADVPTEALLEAVRRFSPELVALSATMPESTPRLERAVAAIAGEHPQVPVLLGGQACGSPRLGEGTVVQDLELLPEKAPLP